MHEVNPEGVFKQLERVTRERDEARAALREVWCGDLGCPFAVCKKIKVALGPLPEKQTEGK